MTARHHTLLLFSSADRIFALPLAQIQEVVPAFEIKVTPGLADMIAGLISFRGRVLPVIDCRRCVDASPTVLHPHQSFIIARGDQREAALLVEHVDDLITLNEDDFNNDGILEAPDQKFRHVVMHAGEMVLVLNIDACFQSTHLPPIAVAYRDEPVAQGTIREY